MRLDILVYFGTICTSALCSAASENQPPQSARPLHDAEVASALAVAKATLYAQLKDLLQQYDEAHPKVRRLQDQIRQLEAKADGGNRPQRRLKASAGDAGTTLVDVGDIAPPFAVTTTEGQEISLEKLKGRVILVNFFATWCGPCLAELPHLESEVWEKFKTRGLTVLVIGREHSIEELKKFKTEKKLSMTFAADPKRVVYGKYATKSIPRNFVIAADGRVVFQSTGFDKADFQDMKRVIEAELAKQSGGFPAIKD